MEEVAAVEPSDEPPGWLDTVLGTPAAAAAAAPPPPAGAPSSASGKVRRYGVPLSDAEVALKATVMDHLAPPLLSGETVYARFQALFSKLSPSDGGFNTADKVALLYALMHLDGPRFAAAVEAFGFSPEAFDEPAYSSGLLPTHVSEATAASALAQWHSGGCSGNVVVIGATVRTGLEELAPVAAAGRLILVDPRNGLYNSLDPGRDPSLYVACPCDGRGDIFRAVCAHMKDGDWINALLFVDCLYSDDQARVLSESSDALRLAALRPDRRTVIDFLWSGDVAVRAALFCYIGSILSFLPRFFSQCHITGLGFKNLKAFII